MPSGLQRYYGRGHLHFITCSCYQRRPFFKAVRARDIFVQELDRIRRKAGFRLLGYVVMPEHVHLLMGEPLEGDPSTALHDLKLRVAKRLRGGRKKRVEGQRELPFGPFPQAMRSFWQARFYDFNVYTEGKKKEKLNYMHANPVKRGLVEHPKDWRWSSWEFYWGKGKPLIAMDR
jgi:putative transposase